MTYRIELAPAAARGLRELDAPARRRIQAALELVADTPRPPAAEKLVDAGGSWRVRVGDDRILYDIHDDRLLILVLQAGHRREIYPYLG